MKRLVLIFLMMAFCLEAQRAFCQVKSDFSDWNVPPPVPTGTIPKSPGVKSPAVLELPTDLPAPNLQSIDLKLAALSPALQTAPDVAAPDQPQFPLLPFETPGIPLPSAPAAMELPKQTLHDEAAGSSTDMPEPTAPEMPEFPKRPDINQQSSGGVNSKVPLMPAIIIDQGSAALPADAFPFLEWPVPGIPENSEINADQSGSPNNDKTKPINKKKTAKKIKGG